MVGGRGLELTFGLDYVCLTGLQLTARGMATGDRAESRASEQCVIIRDSKLLDNRDSDETDWCYVLLPMHWKGC